jgi:hypothetical protein
LDKGGRTSGYHRDAMNPAARELLDDFYAPFNRDREAFMRGE